MARSKGKGKALPVEKGPKSRRPPRSDSDTGDDDDYVGEPGFMADARGIKPAAKKQKQGGTSDKTMEEGMEADQRKKWVNSLKAGKCKNERQVDAGGLGEGYGVPQIRREGLLQWFDKLPGYNLKLVREFYQHMDVILTTDTERLLRVESKVGNQPIVITADRIARYLKYRRPDPSAINYPREAPIDPDFIKATLYGNPAHATVPIKPSRFKENIRILNKAVHANLYPRGKEHVPSQKSAELMVAFMDPDIVVDWAEFILAQIADFYDNNQPSLRMWFPCLISDLCKKQGVKGPSYGHMEPLRPGVIDYSTLEKSRSQSKHAKVKRTMAGASSSQSAAPTRAELFKRPKKGAKMITWIKQLLSCQRAAYKKQERIEKRQEKLLRGQQRIEAKTDWLIERQGASSGDKYVTPPELEDIEEESEEETEDEEEAEPESGEEESEEE